MRTYAPKHHAPTGGPWSFTLPNAYFASTTAPGATPPDAAAGARRLLLAYLRAFGPASVQDFARFTLLGRGHPGSGRRSRRSGRRRPRCIRSPPLRLEGGTGMVPDETPPCPLAALTAAEAVCGTPLELKEISDRRGSAV
ncbi:DNA glycosylase AlkZ-like family protein [Streptomyces scopuliridis]|uniref:DNA glycosylase AlkZ-like family protein n=1 Tax=Streptomyces scopuliridis TaxID=452529 RepID=UPI0036A870F2